MPPPPRSASDPSAPSAPGWPGPGPTSSNASARPRYKGRGFLGGSLPDLSHHREVVAHPHFGKRGAHHLQARDGDEVDAAPRRGGGEGRPRRRHREPGGGDGRHHHFGAD